MSKRSLAEQLNQAVQAMLDHPGTESSQIDRELSSLLKVAAELRNLPREEFKARLKRELQEDRGLPLAAAEETMRPTASPYLTVRDAAAAIEFYKRAFGARENMRLTGPDGKVMHAEIQIGNAPILLADEYPQYGALTPQTLGGSPVKMHLRVDDVDSFAKHAVAEGAKIVRPIANQFYGHRAGQLEDPFGYVWIASTTVEDLTVEEVEKRFQGMIGQPRVPGVAMREGFRTLTAYIVAQNVPGLIGFLQQTFDAEETMRSGPGSEGGMHCEVRVGDSMLMIGGGGGGFPWKGKPRPGAFHIYVRDCDATYARALEAGAVAMETPADQEYGERTAAVRDAAGNYWFLATFQGQDFKSEGAPTIQPYFHPLRGEPMIRFLKNAFGASEMGRATSPEGVIQHVTLKIGDAQLELGEAHGKYQPMKSSYMLYVPDVDATYRRAIAAGAVSMSEPADQGYGERTGAVSDVFGNQWYMATPIKG